MDETILELLVDVSKATRSVEDFQKQIDATRQKMDMTAGVKTLTLQQTAADQTAIKLQAEKLAATKNLKAATQDLILQDKAMLETMGKAKLAQEEYGKAVKDSYNELKNKIKVEEALKNSEKQLAEIQDKYAKGALTLADAEKRHMEAAKRLAEEYIREKKVIEDTGKATDEQKKKLKELEQAIKANAEAADSFGDAQLELNRIMQNADDRLSGNIKTIGSFGIALSGMGATLTSAFGGAGGIMAEFTGSIGMAANQWGGFIDQMKEGKDMGGLQGKMTQLTAYAGMAQIALQVGMQAFQAIDGAIRKQEQAVIDAGKSATEQSNLLKNYSLGNKTFEDRVKLIEEVSKSDQKLASSLRGLAGDATAFQAALDKANEKLRETRELGAAKEFEVSQTGGGLLGWIKKLGTEIPAISATMGKFRVAMDEVRQAAATSSQAFMEANNAAQSYMSSGTSKIKDLQIQIAEAEGNTAKARELRIQAIRDEAQATKELIEEKVMLLNIELSKARSEAGIIGRTYLDLDKKIQEEIAWVRENPGKALQRDIPFKDLGGTIQRAIDQIYKEIGNRTITKQEELMARLEELTTIKGFGGGLIGMAWQKNIKAALMGMLDVIPGKDEANATVKSIQEYIKSLQDKIPALDATTTKIIDLTQKLWHIQDEQKNRQAQEKQPTVTPTVPEPKIPELDINKFWAKKLVEWSKVYAAMPVEKIQPALDTLAQRLNRATENSLKGSGIDLSFYTEKIRKEMTVAATAMGEELGKQATNYDSYKTIMDTLIAKRDELSKKTDAGSKMELESINLVIDSLKDEKDAIDAIISSYIRKGEEIIHTRIEERDALLDTRTALEKRQDATNKQFDDLVKLAKEQGNYNDQVKEELDLQRQSALDLDKEIEAIKEKLELEKKIKSLREEYAKQAEADAKKAQQDAIKDKYATKTDWIGLEQDIENVLINPLLKVKTTLESITEAAITSYNEASNKASMELDLARQSEQDRYEAEKEKYKDLPEVLEDIERKHAENLKDIDKKFQESRLSAAKDYAEKLTNLYQSEAQKLLQMQDDLAKKIKDRETATANARLEVAEYVTRQKLSETDRQAYDQAKALGQEYERLRKAGLSEMELQEWLKYKTIESTKGMNAEQLASFEKFWDERKKGAELAAEAEKQAWNDQIDQTKKQILEQQELVDALKQKAQDAVNMMREMLGLSPIITGEGIPKTRSEPVELPGFDHLPPEVRKMLEKLLAVNLPVDSWIGKLYPGTGEKTGKLIEGGGTGSAYVTPGNENDSWIGKLYPGTGEKTGKLIEGGGTGSAYTTPGEGLNIPPGTTAEDMAQISTQTREEIQARIDAYSTLKTTAKETEIELQKQAKATLDEIIKIFKEGKPDPNKDFGKEFVDAFKQEGKDAFTGLAKPIKNGMEDLIREMPGYGQRLSNMLARGLQDAEGFLDRAVLEHVVKIIQKYLESHSPPKEGPLSTIDKWPAGLIGAFAGGFTKTDVQYAINNTAQMFADTFGNAVQSKSKTWWQSVYVPQGSGGLTWGEGTKDTSWQYNAFRNQLLKPEPVKTAYEKRVRLLAGQDEGLEAFKQVQTYTKEQKQRSELLSKIGSYDKQRYESFFNQWYDKSLMVGDLGKLTMNDLIVFVKLHPDRAKMPAWHDRIVKANADLYYEAIGKKILPLAAIPEGWSNKTRALDGRIMYEGGGKISQTTQRTSSAFDYTNAGGVIGESTGYDWKEGWDYKPSQWGNLSTGKHWILDEEGNKVFTDAVTSPTAKKEFKDSPFAQGFDAGSPISKFQWQEEKTWSGATGFNEWLQKEFDNWRKTNQKGWNANDLISWSDAEKAFTEYWAGTGDIGAGGKALLVLKYKQYLESQGLTAPTENIKKLASESGWGSLQNVDYLLSGGETTRGDLIKGIWERLTAKEDNPFAGQDIREIMTQIVGTLGLPKEYAAVRRWTSATESMSDYNLAIEEVLRNLEAFDNALGSATDTANKLDSAQVKIADNYYTERGQTTYWKTLAQTANATSNAITVAQALAQRGTENYDYLGETPGLAITPETAQKIANEMSAPGTGQATVGYGGTEYLDQIPRGIPVWTEEEAMHKGYQAATGDTGKDQYGMHGWTVQGPPGSDPYEEWLKYQTVEGLNPDIIPLPQENWMGNRVEASGATFYINVDLNIENVNGVEDFEKVLSETFTDVLTKAGIVGE